MLFSKISKHFTLIPSYYIYLQETIFLQNAARLPFFFCFNKNWIKYMLKIFEYFCKKKLGGKTTIFFIQLSFAHVASCSPTFHY